MNGGLEMPTVSYNVASKIWALYVNNVSHMKLCRDGVIWEPKQESGEPQRLNMKKIHNHLRGVYNVAVFCSQKSSKFICFDVDINDGGVVRKLIDVLVDLGFDRERIYISISGGKGYHVEIFFDKVVANESIANYKSELYKTKIKLTDYKALIEWYNELPWWKKMFVKRIETY